VQEQLRGCGRCVLDQQPDDMRGIVKVEVRVPEPGYLLPQVTIRRRHIGVEMLSVRCAALPQLRGRLSRITHACTCPHTPDIKVTYYRFSCTIPAYVVLSVCSCRRVKLCTAPLG
jgi:hypothetical protein